MKQRAFLRGFLTFLAGMGVAYGLVYLDRQAMVPRLDRTDIFEVVSSDGTVLRLSYAEIEREREELLNLRRRIEDLEAAGHRRTDRGQPPATRGADVLRAEPPPQEASGEPGGEPGTGKRPKVSDKDLKSLFAKIFSQPVLEDLVQAQVTREAGELADVLDLTDEQLATLEEELKKRRKRSTRGLGQPPSEPSQEDATPQRSLEEELRSLLTPEQYQRYQEYTEKKSALRGSSTLDREVFELNWRLGLTEEQEVPVRDILRQQSEKMAQISSVAALEGKGSPIEGLQKHLEQRTAVNKETGERMKVVLDEDQFEAFVRYQEERDTETRLLKRLIQEEQAAETPATP